MDHPSKSKDLEPLAKTEEAKPIPPEGVVPTTASIAAAVFASKVELDVELLPGVERRICLGCKQTFVWDPGSKSLREGDGGPNSAIHTCKPDPDPRPEL